MIWIFLGVIFLMFGLVVFVGAPYLPALKHQIETGLDLLDLQPGQTMIDLGCGDGKVLVAAARRGYRVVGVELNPVLALVARIRTWRYRRLVSVRCADFWHSKLPVSDGVFVFLIPRLMPKLDQLMKRRGGKLVSVAFRIPGSKPVKERNDVFLYEYEKLASRE